MLPPGYPKTCSPIRLAVWPAIANIYIYIYEKRALLYTDYEHNARYRYLYNIPDILLTIYNKIFIIFDIMIQF